MVQHGLPAGWEIAGRLGGGEVPGMAWLGKLSDPEAQPGADDRYAAVVALTAEKPDFRLAVRVRAVTPGNVRAARRRGGGHAPRPACSPVRPPGASPSWQPSEQSRPIYSPSPCGRGLGGGGHARTAQPPPPNPLPQGEGELVLLALLALLPRSASRSPPSAPCSTASSLPISPASPPSAAKSSTARTARWHCSPPRVASGAFGPTPRRRCSPTC